MSDFHLRQQEAVQTYGGAAALDVRGKDCFVAPAERLQDQTSRTPSHASKGATNRVLPVRIIGCEKASRN
jgi:hypothetical protein